MPKIRELTGQKFGKLTVIRRVENQGRYPKWECKCVCGNITNVISHSLVSKNTKSCGCGQHEQRVRPFESQYTILLNSARKRKIECSLTYDDFLNFTNTTECHYCGISMVWEKQKKRYTGYSGYNLDRKDSNIGYTVGNCVVCCGRCNRGKMHLYSYDEWKAIGGLIKAMRERRNYAYIHEA